ncbi:MAG: TPM domain-containing protein, partial [Rubrivivax sp.]
MFSGLVYAQTQAQTQTQEPLPVPALTARVMDQTATLSPAQRQALEAKLAAFEAQAGPQIVVLMVATTQPEDIAAFAQRGGETWLIGRTDGGDGVLRVVGG